MPEFVWSGVSVAAARVTQEEVAVNESVLRAKLQKQNFSDIKIKKKPKDLLENIAFLQPKVTTKDIVIFYPPIRHHDRRWSSFGPVFGDPRKQQENKTFKKILTQVKTSVEGGSTFAEGLKQHLESL